MQLVMLAAGFGTRFGGLKQLAPVGPNDEAIMDYTAAGAHACGFDGAVLVIRKEIEDEVHDHITRNWPKDFPVEYVYQPAVRGTATAVLASREFVTGPFAVANADDLYGNEALALIPEHFGSENGADTHLLVAYRLASTVLGASEVKRGLCEINDRHELCRIEEHVIIVRSTEVFEASPIGRAAANRSDNEIHGRRILSGNEYVSMNLWGFHEAIFEHLAAASATAAPDNEQELLLPDVVEDVIDAKAETVRVVATEARCIGLTNPADLAIVREQILAQS